MSLFSTQTRSFSFGISPNMTHVNNISWFFLDSEKIHSLLQPTQVQNLHQLVKRNYKAKLFTNDTVNKERA